MVKIVITGEYSVKSFSPVFDQSSSPKMITGFSFLCISRNVLSIYMHVCMYIYFAFLHKWQFIIHNLPHLAVLLNNITWGSYYISTFTSTSIFVILLLFTVKQVCKTHLFLPMSINI